MTWRVQTRPGLRRGVGLRARVRGAAELRGGAGAGPGRRRARAALARARAAPAQRVQAARAPLRLGRGRLVLAARARARRAALLLTRPRAPRTISFYTRRPCVHRRLPLLSGSDVAPGPPRPASEF